MYLGTQQGIVQTGSAAEMRVVGNASVGIYDDIPHPLRDGLTMPGELQICLASTYMQADNLIPVHHCNSVGPLLELVVA